MKRNIEQLKEHYLLEKELANKLKQSSFEERKYLYSSIYDELYRKVPHNPTVARNKNPKELNNHVYTQMRFLKRFIGNINVFAEIGPGDCSLSIEISKNVKKVYAIDISKEVSKNITLPANVELIISDGINIPLSQNSIEIFYSNQLIEHIHPDDLMQQLAQIKNKLITGGKYVCVTPNRINGPHDISRYFDKVASGFHLKEYTYTELTSLFEKIGFTKINVYIGAKGIYLRIPLSMILSLEKLLTFLPYLIRKSIIFKPFLFIRIVAIK